MKWVVLAIVVSLGLYTYFTLHFRKSEREYRPYQDVRDRVTVSRLLSAGYHRIPARIERPADPARSRAQLGGNLAAVQDAIGGFSAELNDALIDKPALPDAFTDVFAPNEANTLLPYSIQFTCTLPNEKSMVGDTYVYKKERELAIVPAFDRLDGDLLARSKNTVVQLTLPSGSLEAGMYHVTLVGAHGSKQWTLQVH